MRCSVFLAAPVAVPAVAAPCASTSGAGQGYGLSNDAPALFGRPSFDRVRVAVALGDAAVRIRRRYP